MNLLNIISGKLFLIIQLISEELFLINQHNFWRTITYFEHCDVQEEQSALITWVQGTLYTATTTA